MTDVTAPRRFRVLLVSANGTIVDGFYDYRGDELPDEGATINVRDMRDRARVIRARVTHVTPGDSLPIAAIELDA